jgi:two-component system cell cycle response regulator DivK
MPKKILYIEDNRLNRRLVRKLLTHYEYEVIEAPDGETGIQMILEEKPDLVFLDINLPDIDGFEVVKHIRTMSEVKETPIIALTANAMIGDKERCLQAGCDGYLAKPIVRQELYETINHYLQDI